MNVRCAFFLYGPKKREKNDRTFLCLYGFTNRSVINAF